MRIGVISDTHGKVGATLDAVSIFEDRAVDTVIHCGDTPVSFGENGSGS